MSRRLLVLTDSKPLTFAQRNALLRRSVARRLCVEVAIGLSRGMLFTLVLNECCDVLEDAQTLDPQPLH